MPRSSPLVLLFLIFPLNLRLRIQITFPETMDSWHRLAQMLLDSYNWDRDKREFDTNAYADYCRMTSHTVQQGIHWQPLWIAVCLSYYLAIERSAIAETLAITSSYPSSGFVDAKQDAPRGSSNAQGTSRLVLQFSEKPIDLNGFPLSAQNFEIRYYRNNEQVSALDPLTRQTIRTRVQLGPNDKQVSIHAVPRFPVGTTTVVRVKNVRSASGSPLSTFDHDDRVAFANLPGDVNWSGTVDTNDYIHLRRMLILYQKGSSTELANLYDINRDNTFDNKDITRWVELYSGNHSLKSWRGTSIGQINEPLWATLSRLSELSKEHYSWPFSSAFLDDPKNKKLLYEYARLSHSITIWGYWATQEQVLRVLKILTAVNQKQPHLPATLSLTFRPWSVRFPVDASPMHQGREEAIELEYLHERLTTIRNWLETYNTAHGTNIQLGAILLECERFFIKEANELGATAWNAAIDRKHNLVYDSVRSVFPQAKVEWYARSLSSLFTLKEKGDSFSVPLYRVMDPIEYETLYRRALNKAKEKNVERVSPWIALGTGYRLRADGSREWAYNNDYDIRHSAQIGGLFHNYKPSQTPANANISYDAAQAVIFYPRPFEPLIPRWGEHFIAYVQGATGDNVPE